MLLDYVKWRRVFESTSPTHAYLTLDFTEACAAFTEDVTITPFIEQSIQSALARVFSNFPEISVVSAKIDDVSDAARKRSKSIDLDLELALVEGEYDVFTSLGVAQNLNLKISLPMISFQHFDWSKRVYSLPKPILPIVEMDADSEKMVLLVQPDDMDQSKEELVDSFFDSEWFLEVISKKSNLRFSNVNAIREKGKLRVEELNAFLLNYELRKDPKKVLVLEFKLSDLLTKEIYTNEFKEKVQSSLEYRSLKEYKQKLENIFSTLEQRVETTDAGDAKEVISLAYDIMNFQYSLVEYVSDYGGFTKRLELKIAAAQMVKSDQLLRKFMEKYKISEKTLDGIWAEYGY